MILHKQSIAGAYRTGGWKPTDELQINPRHPLASVITAAVVGNRRVEIISGIQTAPTLNGVPSIADTSEGRAFTFNGAQKMLFNIPTYASQVATTIIAHCLLTTKPVTNPAAAVGMVNTTSDSGFAIGYSTGGVPGVYVRTSNGYLVSGSGSGDQTNNWVTLGVEGNAPGILGNLYQNGTLFSGITASGGFTGNINCITLGELSGGLRPYTGQIAWAMGFSIPLGQAWQTVFATEGIGDLFRPVRRPQPLVGLASSLSVREGSSWGEEPWGRRAWGLPPFVAGGVQTFILAWAIPANFPHDGGGS